MFGYHSLPITPQGRRQPRLRHLHGPEVFPELGNIFAPGAKVIHIDLNAYEIAKNHPVDLGLVSDPKLTLALLATALEASPDAQRRRAPRPRARARRASAGHAEELAADGERSQCRDATPLHFVPLHGGAGAAAARTTPSSSTRR